MRSLFGAVAVARRILLSELWVHRGIPSPEEATVAVQGMRQTDVSDGWDRPASYPRTASVVVPCGLSGQHYDAGTVGGPVAATTRRGRL